jgi:hypothetical protein
MWWRLGRWSRPCPSGWLQAGCAGWVCRLGCSLSPDSSPKKVSTVMLILFGDNSRAVGLTDLRRLRRRIPGGDLRLLRLPRRPRRRPRTRGTPTRRDWVAHRLPLGRTRSPPGRTGGTRGTGLSSAPGCFPSGPRDAPGRAGCGAHADGARTQMSHPVAVLVTGPTDDPLLHRLLRFRGIGHAHSAGRDDRPGGRTPAPRPR